MFCVILKLFIVELNFSSLILPSHQLEFERVNKTMKLNVFVLPVQIDFIVEVSTASTFIVMMSEEWGAVTRA